MSETIIGPTKVWYRVRRHGLEIKPYDVVKETDKTITIVETAYGGRPRELRQAKNNGDTAYFPTFDAARDHLMAILQTQYQYAQDQVVRYGNAMRDLAVRPEPQKECLTPLPPSGSLRL